MSLKQSDSEAVLCFLKDLQGLICDAFEAEDAKGHFSKDSWRHSGSGGGGVSRVLQDGATFEKAAVNFSHVFGETLPPSASLQHAGLDDCGFEAMGVSVITHPSNPYVPVSHFNVRLFMARSKHEVLKWWFGGGFDLSPCYGFKEDATHWHRMAKAACAGFREDLYEELKAACDAYFFLKHRDEPRGIGGLFFDDYKFGGFQRSFDFVRSVSENYLKAYLPIVQKRKSMAFEERQRRWQLHRRGRYVEFNLLYDRGTLFGLQSGGRSESILVSMPPLVRWDYNFEPSADSEEAGLVHFLKAMDWT